MRIPAGVVSMAIVAAAFAAAPRAQGTGPESGWASEFAVQSSDLASTGRNDFVILEPGHQASYAHGDEQLVITVLAETKMVAGVETRVVEERETKGGRPVETSRNYFAISTSTHDVYYFGEEVDIFKNGKVTAHEGAWLAGVAGARFGLTMPARPVLKQRYYQEIAPKIAMDRAEVVSLTETVKTPAGTFTNCLKTRETSQIERGSEFKYYAAGVGLVKDDDMVLVKTGVAR